MGASTGVSPSARAWIVAPLVFVSGLCSLIYQVVWTRELRLVFGASTAASSAVVAIFIAGLGAGGAWFGRRAERQAPLRMYGQLELGIAATSALTPWLLDLVRVLYAASGGSLALGIAGSTGLRLALATVVLGPPTFLMGGTLPAVTRAIETNRDTERRGVALVYGVNTLGAVAGCLASTFVMLEAFGGRKTLYFAALVNVLTATLALVSARKIDVAPTATDDMPTSVAIARVRAQLVFASAGLVGFAFFLMELVWYRLLGPLLGGSTFTFGLILAVALAGIGLGSALYAALGARCRPSFLAFALTCALEAMFLALPYALGDLLAIWALMLRSGGSQAFHQLVLGWAVIAAIVIFPAALLSGFQFPLLIGLLGRGRNEVARHVGAAYAANTVGAVVGALAGGFGLLPILGALGAWRFVCFLLVGWAVLIAGFAISHDAVRARALWVAGSVALVVVFLRTEGPTAFFRHAPIGAGRLSAAHLDSPSKINQFITRYRRGIAWQTDGMESALAISSFDGYGFIVNGRSDGHSRLDAPTQVMSGLVGAALVPHVKRALVIGLGTGSTAGWLAKLPEIERVDVAEIEPAILEVAKRCAPVNEDVLHNPKVRIFRGDARELLAVSRVRYDVIFSEPSNPYRAGIASLYTQEFYRVIRQRLAPSGIFVQWMQAYEIDVDTERTIYATLGSVFPQIETWNGHDLDLLLVASGTAPAHDVAALRERLASEPFARAMRAAWLTSGLEGFLAHFRANSNFARAVGREDHPPINTDDHGVIEFGLSRSLGTAARAGWVGRESRKRNQHRPAVRNGSVDWQRVDFEAEASILSGGYHLPSDEGLPTQYSQRLLSLTQWANGDLNGALTQWASLDAASPIRSDPIVLEELAVAESMAHSGDEHAEAWLSALERRDPTEAIALRGVWLARRGRIHDACEMLVDALHRYRVDPWPLLKPMERAMSVLEAGTLSGRADTLRWLEALSQPFAARVNEDVRQSTRLSIARTLGPKDDACLPVVQDMEPIAPWAQEPLEFRAACYAAHHHPLAAKAADDLRQFVTLQRM